MPAALRAPIRPRYPPTALQQGLEGSATLLVFVAGDGRVVGLRLLASDHEEFTHAAAEALRATPFAPARRDGRPVGSTVTIRVVFALE